MQVDSPIGVHTQHRIMIEQWPNIILELLHTSIYEHTYTHIHAHAHMHTHTHTHTHIHAAFLVSWIQHPLCNVWRVFWELHLAGSTLCPWCSCCTWRSRYLLVQMNYHVYNIWRHCLLLSLSMCVYQCVVVLWKMFVTSRQQSGTQTRSQTCPTNLINCCRQPLSIVSG